MVKTKKHYGIPVLTFYILILISVICVISTIIGCSSKKDEGNTEKSSSAKTEVNTPLAAQEPKLPILPISPLPDANQIIDANQTVDVNQQTNIPQAAEKNNKPSEVKIVPAILLNEFNRTSSGEKKVELLGTLSDMAINQDPNVIGIAQTAAADKDANVALAGIELLQGYENPQILPAVTQAMTNPDEDVRRTAVNLLLDVNDPRTGKLLSNALSDESEDIRSIALDEIKYKEKDVQFEVLKTAISSPYSDVKDDSIFMLQYVGGPQAVDVLIEALRDKNAEFREEASSALSTLIDKEFTSYQEAKSWWKKNKKKYDEDLTLIEEEQ
jgi:hypothetical protein